MKKLPRSDGWLASVVLASFLLAGFAGCGGCAAGKGQYNPGTGQYDTNAPASSLVVGAENFREIALNTFDAIMTIERQHEAALKELNPEIHKFAQKVRRESKGWLNDLTEAKKAYQLARTDANATKLQNAVGVIDAALVIATKYLAQSAEVKEAK